MELGTHTQRGLAPTAASKMKKLEQVVSAAQRALEDPADFLELVEKHVGGVEQLRKDLYLRRLCFQRAFPFPRLPPLLHVSPALPERSLRRAPVFASPSQEAPQPTLGIAAPCHSQVLRAAADNC